jgi:uncharacterized Rmd1/YagE family protein
MVIYMRRPCCKETLAIQEEPVPFKISAYCVGQQFQEANLKRFAKNQGPLYGLNYLRANLMRCEVDHGEKACEEHASSVAGEVRHAVGV